MDSAPHMFASFDPGISPAVAIWQDGLLVHLELLDTPASMDEPDRLASICEWVDSLHEAWSLEEAAIEHFIAFFGSASTDTNGRRYRHDRGTKRNPRSLFLMKAGQTAVQTSLIRHRIPFSLYPPGAWKPNARGQRQGKAPTQEAVSERYGLKVNDHLADAVLIGEFHLNTGRQSKRDPKGVMHWTPRAVPGPGIAG